MRENRQNRIRYLLIGGALLCFAYLAWEISTHDILAFDTVVREWAYNQRGPVLNKIVIAITYLGNWQTVVILALILLILPESRFRYGLPFVSFSAASTVIYKCMKSVFARPRPDLAVRIIQESGWSFPSGHSMNCMVCYGILIYLVRRHCKNKRAADLLTVLLALLILAIGCSRIYVGVHFPTDVLGGWSLGLAFLLVCTLIYEKTGGKNHDL
ncbi:phosphatase PAP2 family protein [Ihubacter sp. mB4P-1]|uniref:phosphatase PAP2 family protein n=1 Tax=Ihubacter sp. mB4P-1 TaxID=3242370 RepID=UPI003C7B7AD6